MRKHHRLVFGILRTANGWHALSSSMNEEREGGKNKNKNKNKNKRRKKKEEKNMVATDTCIHSFSVLSLRFVCFPSCFFLFPSAYLAQSPTDKETLLQTQQQRLDKALENLTTAMAKQSSSSSSLCTRSFFFFPFSLLFVFFFIAYLAQSLTDKETLLQTQQQRLDKTLENLTTAIQKQGNLETQTTELENYIKKLEQQKQTTEKELTELKEEMFRQSQVRMEEGGKIHQGIEGREMSQSRNEWMCRDGGRERGMMYHSVWLSILFSVRPFPLFSFCLVGSPSSVGLLLPYVGSFPSSQGREQLLQWNQWRASHQSQLATNHSRTRSAIIEAARNALLDWISNPNTRTKGKQTGESEEKRRRWGGERKQEAHWQSSGLDQRLLKHPEMLYSIEYQIQTQERSLIWEGKRKQEREVQWERERKRVAQWQ